MAHNEFDESGRLGNRAMILRQSAADVTRANALFAEHTPEISGHPGYQWGISEILNVFDLVREELSVIFLRRAGSRPSALRPEVNLLKFTKRKHAPFVAKELQLATPEFYRKYEGSAPGVADPKDGCLTKDATPWMTKALVAPEILAPGVSLSLKAEMTFASPEEPWIYCASVQPDGASAMRELRSKFPQYDTVTVIEDRQAFARQLGIDFALSFDRSKDVHMNVLYDSIYAQSNYTTSLWSGRRNIDKFVNVYHGPVRYEDQSGVLETLEDVVDPYGAPRAWFTKGTKFSDQREYRFALSTPGTPRKSELQITVSDEIRRLVAEAPQDIQSDRT